MVLQGCEPRAVFGFFEDICGIPHGSGNEKALTDYLLGFAKKRGLWAARDGALNVIIKKPAAQGYETARPVILQAHLDMVCAKADGVDFDFERDALQIYVEDDMIKAKGTTLGADNGVGAALILALLDASEVSHPPLEAVFTTREEVGLIGAMGMDATPLEGRRMINLDSGGEGVIVVSCAGGLRTAVRLPVRSVAAPAGYKGYYLSITDLKGGHSGGAINKERGNACVLLGRALYKLRNETDLYISEITGGDKDNAIPREARALLLTDKNPEQAVAAISDTISSEYRVTEPDIRICLTAASAPTKAFDKASGERIISALLTLPNGVRNMTGEDLKFVETSNNLATVRAVQNDTGEANGNNISCDIGVAGGNNISCDIGVAVITLSLRSSVSSRKHALLDQIEVLAALLGGSAESSADYPPWEYRPDSALRDAAAGLYEELNGQPPKFLSIHGGLECGVLGSKIPGLDMISIGPEIHDGHTPKERASIPSAARMWEYLTTLLGRLK